MTSTRSSVINKSEAAHSAERVSIFDAYSDGYCPQCMLEGRRESMVLNRDDFWECPVCRLQAHSASGGMFAILRQRGERKLKDTLAREHVVGQVLTKDLGARFPRADSSGFGSEQELRAFLDTELRDKPAS